MIRLAAPYRWRPLSSNVRAFMNLRSLSAALGLVFTLDANAQIEVHLAFMKERPDSKIAWFPNDKLFHYMSNKPFISRAEMLRAKPGYADEQAFVEITVTPEARKRLNKLAASNAKNQDHGTFEQHVGLTFVVDSDPRVVIQSVFQPMVDNRIWWHLGRTGPPRAESLAQAEVLAKRINERKP